MRLFLGAKPVLKIIQSKNPFAQFQLDIEPTFTPNLSSKFGKKYAR
jgi:hypothetical protein